MNLKLIWEQTQENYRGCLSALSDKPPISGLKISVFPCNSKATNR
jgi:hypothetical protein